MADMTIYLPDELREQVKAAGIPVSRICQQALRSTLAELGVNSTPHVIDGQLAIELSVESRP